MNCELELTADGAATLYRRDIDEHYHSVKGALTESRHVYIDSGLQHFASKVQLTSSPIKIVEIGFGTGLNAMLAIKYAIDNKLSISYLGLELYPLSGELHQATGYADIIGVELFAEIIDSPWNKNNVLRDYPEIAFEKRHADALSEIRKITDADVIFMDAFAPEKQREMWEEDFISAIARAMTPGGVLTTYCAKGAVRRALERAGLKCQRLPGPI